MARWYHRIATGNKAAPIDLAALSDALEWFENQYEEAQKELHVKGNRIDHVAANLPGIVEHRYGQFQELESILQFVELIGDKAQAEAKQNLMHNNNRSLTDRQADNYAKVDQKVFDIRLIQLEVARVRNMFLSLTKGFEYMHFQIGHVVRLRSAGMEDSTF